MEQVQNFILYEDNHLIVVHKPPGILSQADYSNDPDMLSLLKNYLKEKYQKPGNVYLGLVHRLDRMTGGVMVFARTSKAAARLADQMQKHGFKKTYLAIVSGTFDDRRGTLIDYLIKDETEVKSYVTTPEQGKKAILTYQVLEEKNNQALLEIALETGRHHQIRVQLASRGHPIVGDVLYGSKIKANLALYAYKLEFFHPVNKNCLSFVVKPQGDLWKQFLRI